MTPASYVLPLGAAMATLIFGGCVINEHKTTWLIPMGPSITLSEGKDK